MKNPFDNTILNAVSVREEAVAYEAIMSMLRESVWNIADQIRSSGLLPSDYLRTVANTMFTDTVVRNIRKQLEIVAKEVSVALYNDVLYPALLRYSTEAPPILYYDGDIEFLQQPSISIVGARKATEEGMRTASELADELVRAGYGITSGLASGIDASAMKSALNADGKVVGVIGTPMSHSYPPENSALQMLVRGKGLLISHVPFCRFSEEPFVSRKYHFTERNILMAGVTTATVIVEASDTSGTLTQARACMKLKRPLFITERCFNSSGLNWPKKYVQQGAIVVKDAADIVNHLAVLG